MRSIVRSGKLLVMLLLFVANFLNAQTHTPKTVNIIAKCKGYYEYLPVNYNTSSNRYPLIIYIHGGASYGNGSATQLAMLLSYEGIPYYINQNQFPSTFPVNGQNTSFIVITPQFSSKPSAAEVKQVIDYILPRYRIDTTRIYLTGYSVGGDVVWKQPTDLAAAYKFAAISPVAGYNNPYSEATAPFIANSGLPVWAIHSNSDVTISVNASQNMVNKINSFSPAVPAIISRLTNVTHNNTVLTAYDPQYKPNGKSMYEWFLGYSRNFPPVARAGNDLSITMPQNSVSFNGSQSSDPENTPLLFNWSKVGGPSQYNITNANTATPTVSNLVAGVYSFRLTVTDQALLVASDTVRVTVVNPNPNQLPVAIAGQDQSVLLPASSGTISASASFDNDGSIESFSWTKIAGPASFTIANPTLATTNVSNLKVGTYRFRVQVTDNQGGTSADTVAIVVINPFPNFIPVARAGANQEITLPASAVSLNASASTDADGNIVSYQWRQLSGPSAGAIASPSSVTTAVNNLVSGIYRIELKVTDDSTASHRDTVQITVNPAVKTIQVNLFGGSNGAGTGWTNWNILSGLNSPALPYSNGLASGITASLSNNTGLGDNGTNYPTTMCPPAVGRHASFSNASRTLTISGLDNSKRYDFEAYASRTGGFPTPFTIAGNTVTITTNNNYSNAARFNQLAPVSGRIVVSIGLVTNYNYLNGFTLTEIASPSASNQSPVSNPGNAQTINLPVTQLTLDGSGSTDPDGMISAYSWQKISGPAANITSPSLAITTVTGLTPGAYIFQLTVTDNAQQTASEYVEVTVTNGPAASLPPKAVAGNNTTIRLPVDSVYLDGSASNDPDGMIQSYRWNKISGPSGFTILNETLPGTLVRELTEGVYRFELAVTDTSGLVGKDTVQVTVLAPNIPPVANAGADRELILPANSLQLDGTASDIDGTIANYSWTKVSGPSSFSISSATIRNPVVSDLTAGVYLLTLNVTDNDGAAGNDTMLIIVHRALNQPPVANAGADQIVRLPQSSATLRATGSADVDGSIVSYEWMQITGPSTAVIVLPNDPSTVVNNLESGEYTFSLKVTDDSAASAFDTVRILVGAANIPPVANAGAGRSITLPLNSLQLDGIASNDPDGTISSYAWSKVAGPTSFTISNSSIRNPVISNLVAGLYRFRLQVTDNDGDTGADTVSITVNRAANTPPVARAGNDQVITFPVSSTTLNGSTSGDNDGVIQSYNWSQAGGPAGAAFANAASATTTVSNLQEGVYRFVLEVTDDSLATAKDTVQVTVNASAPVQRRVKVNMFSGTAPAPSDWNNWNAISTLTFNALKYEDGGTSTIAAVLSNNTNVGDNGTGYPTTMCPVVVGRFASYSTTNRTLTIQGLDNNKRYDFEAYASRTGGTPTIYRIGTTSVTINTDRNFANKASFTNIAPVAGRIVIQMDKVTTWSYLNGFILTENTVAGNLSVDPSLNTGRSTFVQNGMADDINVHLQQGNLAGNAAGLSGNKSGISVLPNPFVNSLSLNLNNSRTGNLNIMLLSGQGQIISQWKSVKTASVFNQQLEVGYLSRGIYMLVVKMDGWQQNIKVIRR